MNLREKSEKLEITSVAMALKVGGPTRVIVKRPQKIGIPSNFPPTTGGPSTSNINMDFRLLMEDEEIPKQCTSEYYTVEAAEMKRVDPSKTQKPDYVMIVSYNDADLVLRQMMGGKNFSTLSNKSMEDARKAWKKCRPQWAQGMLQNWKIDDDLEGLPDDQIVKRGAMNYYSLKQCLAAMYKRIRLESFIGESNVQMLVDFIGEKMLKWPIEFPLFTELPHFKVKSIAWLRNCSFNDQSFNASAMRFAIRDWSALFLIKWTLHQLRREFVLCTGSRAHFHLIFPRKVWKWLKRSGFERYRETDGEVRLEELDVKPLGPVRELWTVVDGSKTRPLAKLTDIAKKKNEQKLNCWLRCCLETFGNDMRDCPQILTDIRERFKGKRTFIFKTDISKCFDNIVLDQLMSIVYDKVTSAFTKASSNSKSNSMVLLKLYEQKGKFRSRFTASFNVDEAYNRMLKTCDLLKVKPPAKNDFVMCSPQKLIDGIREMLLDIPIHHGNAYYQQMRGIPQGSSLSNTLCYMYVKEMLKQAGASGMGILHYVDDLVLVDNDYGRMKTVSSRLMRGVMGLTASAKKSASNFPIPGYADVQKTNRFIWTKWSINGRSLTARPHHQLSLTRLSILQKYSRYRNVRLLATVMKRSGLKGLPKSSIECKKLAENHPIGMYGAIARSVLNRTYYRKYFLRKRPSEMSRSYFIKLEAKKFRAKRARLLASKENSKEMPV